MPTSQLDQIVELTPATRERSIDFLRTTSLAVVVLWHWVFSITHWNASGRLTMPNPIDQIRFAWLATWVLQIMPVFFFVGGFSNFKGIEAARRNSIKPSQVFLKARCSRLLKPVFAFLGAWAAFDFTARLVVPSYTGVMNWGIIVFVPLWFLGVYLGVTILTPITARLHRINAIATIVGLAIGILAVDVLRFEFDIDSIALLNGIFVFTFIHQLGYFFADQSLTQLGARAKCLLIAVPLCGLVIATTIGPYPSSMVATRGSQLSNMFPPTAAIALLGLFQVGLVIWTRESLNRWLSKKKVWKIVVMANSITMPVFLWHMTAYVIVLGTYEVAGFTLPDSATTTWWIQRPIWLIFPALVLSLFLAAVAKLGRSKAS